MHELELLPQVEVNQSQWSTDSNDNFSIGNISGAEAFTAISIWPQSQNLQRADDAEHYFEVGRGGGGDVEGYGLLDGLLQRRVAGVQVPTQEDFKGEPPCTNVFQVPALSGLKTRNPGAIEV